MFWIFLNEYVKLDIVIKNLIYTFIVLLKYDISEETYS